MTRIAAIFVTVFASLAMPAAAAATAHTETASLGQVSARLTYDENQDGFSNLRLSIVRASVPLLDYAVEAPCGQFCLSRPGGGGTRRSIEVRELERDSEPEVVLDVNTGGAHCCDWAYVYSYVPAQNRYTLARRDFGDPGYRLVKLRSRASGRVPGCRRSLRIRVHRLRGLSIPPAADSVLQRKLRR